MLQMTNAGPVLSDADIDGFEKKLNLSLPDPYRKFLLQYNGGRPEPYHFDVAGWKGGPGMVNDFYGIVPGAFNDLEKRLERMRDKLPHDLIPIADDPGGNAVLIGTSGESSGKVFYWDHENQPYDRGKDLAGYPNIYLVAKDFDTFLKQLKDQP